MVGKTRNADGAAGAATGTRVYERLADVLSGPADQPSHQDRWPMPDEPAPGATRPAGALAALDPGRRGIRALGGVAVVVALIAGFIAWRGRPEPQVVASPAALTSPSAASAAPGALVIAVAGKVRSPGLVRLPAGARVADAIEAAGGVIPGTDVAGLNLARKLVDGELVLVGVVPSTAMNQVGAGGAAGSGGQPGQGIPGKVNLNTASLSELDALPGIGPVLAQRIIDFRDRQGGFRATTDLRKVDGIGSARFDQLKELVTV